MDDENVENTPSEAEQTEGDEGSPWVQENVPRNLINSPLFIFNVTFPNKTQVKVNILANLECDYDHLEDQLQYVPAQYMYWAALYSEARAYASILESQYNKRKSSLMSETVTQFRDKGLKATDKQTQSIVDNDEDLYRLSAKIALAQKNVGKLYHMVEAIRLKAENCRSLAGFKRIDKEHSGNVT